MLTQKYTEYPELEREKRALEGKMGRMKSIKRRTISKGATDICALPFPLL
jgi:hypothetical protein